MAGWTGGLRCMPIQKLPKEQNGVDPVNIDPQKNTGYAGDRVL